MQTNSKTLYVQNPTLINVNGDTSAQDIYAGDITELALGINVTAIDAATTLNIFVDTLGSDETWYAVYSSANITAPGTTYASIGAGLSTTQSFGSLVRIRWTITAAKTAHVSLSLIGK